MDVIDCIAADRATREFSDEPVPDEVVRTLVAAAGQAGSGKNRQPWTFVALRERQSLREVAQFGEYTDPLTRAPVGLVVAVDGGESRYRRWNNVFDCGRAGQNLMLAATALGVGTVAQAIRDRDGAGEYLDLPEDRHPVMAVALGYPASGDPPREDVTEEAFERKNRMSVDEILHWERHR